MNFGTLYRTSFYLMLVFATLVLSADPTDEPNSMAFPIIVACAAVVALVSVDRVRGSGLSPVGANVLGLAATALVAAEYLSDPNRLLPTLGHWFVYFQLIYMFRSKTVEIDWHMFLIGLVQVLLGTVLSQVPVVGTLLLCWAVLALWVLGLFSLERDAFRARREGAAGATEADERALYPGLLNPGFLWSAAKVTLVTLGLGGVIFLAMPRRLGTAASQGAGARAQHLTGFDDEVQLGQLGDILENDNEVMRVEFSDENDRSITPEAEPLWRGITMVIYDGGKWVRQGRKSSTFPVISSRSSRNLRLERPGGIVRQKIKLEATDSSTLFGIRPMIDASANRRLFPELNSRDGTIFRSDGRPGVYDYEVRSYVDASLPQPGESAPTLYQMQLLVDMPEDLKPPLLSIADAVFAKMPSEKRDDPRAKALALESYLRDSGQFFYTLKLDVVDPTLDPVVDFLTNRKEGHCEYFASALTLLLRSAGIPARMVNGFKGGDWNYAARAMTVRQKHAHSWVEAYLGPSAVAGGPPLWLTLDPTPGAERAKSVSKVGGLSAYFRQVTDFVSFVWVYYVAGYDAERQQRIIYGPIRRLAEEAKRGFAMMAKGLADLRDSAVRMATFPNAKSIISVRGFLVAFTALLLMVGVFRVIGWFARKVWARYCGPSEDGFSTTPGASHYRRLAVLLGEFHLDRQSSETQEEFARRATSFLSSRDADAFGAGEVPRRVVEAFYRARFGDKELSPADSDELDARLNALEARLRAAQA